MKRKPINLKGMELDRQAMQCRYPAVADASDEIMAWLIEWARKFVDDCDASDDLHTKGECLERIDWIREMLGLSAPEFERLLR